jgi:hypothetical protein
MSYLTNKEHVELITLLKKANVIWQIYEKEHIADDLSHEEWDKFVALYQDNFCEGAYFVVDDLIEDYRTELENKEENNG